MEKVKSLKPYYVKKDFYVGTIGIPDGLVDILDPGYDEPNWCSMRGKKVRVGNYKCYVDVVNFPYEIDKKINDDKRIMSLTIIHVDFADNKDFIQKKRWFTSKQRIGVDAGLCGFYNHKPDFSDEKSWSSFYQNLKKIDGIDCDTTKANGVTVSSGFGDGLYGLRYMRENNQVIGLRLLFN